ncbi:transporter associated domain-containing protein [Buchnera aphidicola (Periphyllus koelreuteriae)]|uniref:TerC family protein n=1 Tax=Buchnera aphidicola TaxID=9 RepID=UPI0031B87DBF
MGFTLNPSAWTGLLALIIIEIVLGMDNIIFLTILVKKLHPKQRKKAKNIGLILSLFIRISFLSLISWSTSLTNPFYSNQYITLSVREVIFLTGGIFLSFVSLLELNDKLCNRHVKENKKKNYSNFWLTICQIVIMDSIFSLDSIITAIGIANNIIVMTLAIIISMCFMLYVLKSIKKFIHKYKAIVVLCLGFLLMIGMSLILEVLGFYIPKTYLYTAIGFSIFIEVFNQLSKYNFLLYQYTRPIRTRVLEKFLQIIKIEKQKTKHIKNEKKNKKYFSKEYSNFKKEEKYMIYSLLNLAIRSIKSMMTPRIEISWININKPINEIKKKLLDTPHSLFPICKGELDKIIGVVRAKELLFIIENNKNILNFVSKNKPIIILETLNPINLLKILKKSKGNIIIVINKFNIVQGLITPLDFLKAIAGDFPDADETPDIIKEKNSWLVKGSTDLHSLKQFLNIKNFFKVQTTHASIAGLLIETKGEIPSKGDIIKISSLNFKIIKVTNYTINLIRITKKNKKKKKNKTKRIK